MGAIKVDHNYQYCNHPIKEWHLDDENKVDVADPFCYLGNILGADGSCDLGVFSVR